VRSGSAHSDKEETMKVRCKFYVASITHHHASYPNAEPTSCVNISLSPIWEEDGPNRKWSKATPNGKIEMTITNPEAAEAFELGKIYNVDFTPDE